MKNNLYRNAEHYYDPTAGAALNNVEREKLMDWKPGDIVTASRGITEKKFIVLANDGFVLTGSVLLTREYDTCVPVVCGDKMYANPYRIEYINPNNYDLSFVRVATAEELDALRTAIANILMITTLPETAKDEEAEDHDSIMVTAEEIDMMQNQAKELIEARTEAKVYRDLYERLLEKMTA